MWVAEGVEVLLFDHPGFSKGAVPLVSGFAGSGNRGD